MTPKKFSLEYIVGDEDIDELNHVNNLVYLHILQSLAMKYWETIAPKEVRMSLEWVVRRHEIDYFYPAFLGDKLILKTWIETLSGVRSIRKYEIYREEKLIVSSSTVWIAIDSVSQKPKRIPVGDLKEYFFED